MATPTDPTTTPALPGRTNPTMTTLTDAAIPPRAPTGLQAPAWPVAVVITSFGYLHGPAPHADITVDVRTHLRDPHTDPRVRELTGRNAVVRARVLITPGVRGLIEGITTATKALLLGPGGGCSPVRVAIGCAGGRHRSVVIADHIAQRLTLAGWDTTTEHLHLHHDLVTRKD